VACFKRNQKTSQRLVFLFPIKIKIRSIVLQQRNWRSFFLLFFAVSPRREPKQEKNRQIPLLVGVSIRFLAQKNKTSKFIV
jgi:hypothetical protein